MPNIDEVKAGKYELVALQWDQPLSKPGEPFDFKRHRRGDVVDLDVEEARRLVLAGAVMKPGERQKAEAAAAAQAYAVALAQVPVELAEGLPEAKLPEPEPSTSPEPADPEPVQAQNPAPRRRP